MTPDQLSAIRENVSFDDVSIHDVIPLLAEVERLREENTVLLEANEGEPWAWQVLAKQRDAAFARGAEAMRTSLLQRVSWGSDLADRIRAEPVPEDK
jgi:hypothetical protein